MNFDLSNLTNEHIKEETLLLSRQTLINNAKINMVDFCKIMMPDSEDPDDADKSEYQAVGHAKMLCGIVEGLQSARMRRVAVSLPPQHGKTQHLTCMGLAWIWGQNPKAKIIVATYNQIRADELGHEFRQMIKDRPVYEFKQVPKVSFYDYVTFLQTKNAAYLRMAERGED